MSRREHFWFAVAILLPFVLVILFIMAETAWGQADIRPSPVAGVYDVGVQCPPELDVARVCLKRVDVSPAVELVCASCAPGEVVRIETTVLVTPGTDAEVRGVAYDGVGNGSSYSPNKADFDFTVVRGDVNDDGAVNYIDAWMILLGQAGNKGLR
jgi:hypothetical protein